MLKSLPEAVWDSEMSVATEDMWFFLATCFSTQLSSSESLHGLPLCGQPVVTPGFIHFIIIALIVCWSRSRNITNRLVSRGTYFEGATFKPIEFFSMTHTTTIVLLHSSSFKTWFTCCSGHLCTTSRLHVVTNDCMILLSNASVVLSTCGCRSLCAQPNSSWLRIQSPHYLVLTRRSCSALH